MCNVPQSLCLTFGHAAWEASLDMGRGWQQGASVLTHWFYVFDQPVLSVGRACGLLPIRRNQQK